MKTFHHSTLDSPRLAKLLAYLRERGNLGATTFELTAECLTTRAASDVSELRANGIPVACEYVGMSNGRKVHRYKVAA